MKKAILLALLLAGCDLHLDGAQIVSKPPRGVFASPNSTPIVIPPSVAQCRTKMVMGMAEITC